MRLTRSVRDGPLEITDLLWRFDAVGRREPVPKAEVIDTLRARGQRRAAALVARLPAPQGVLDAQHIDALGIRVHCELQRLEEELQFGRRVADTLRPLTGALLAEHGRARIVDVGCGLAFVLRALAADDQLGPGVELLGVDLNPVLIAEASASPSPRDSPVASAAATRWLPAGRSPIRPARS